MTVRPHNLIKRRNEGFTIIEIIGVIVIIGIIAAVAIPSFQSPNIDVATAAASIQTDIIFVQELSFSRDPQSAGAITLTLTSGASSYTITDPGNIYTQTRTLPSSVSITTGGTISFNKYGEPEFAGASKAFTITAGGKVQTLTIEQYTGRVTIS